MALTFNIPAMIAHPACARAYCRQRLSGNESPAEVFFVGDLPRASAGKVKRAALPAFLGALTQTKAAGAPGSSRNAVDRGEGAW